MASTGLKSCALDLDLGSQGWKTRRVNGHSTTILDRTMIAKCRGLVVDNVC
jgi:hypothetical protein